MDWWVTLIVMLGVLIILLLSSIPVAFAFMVFNIIGILYFMGPAGFNQLIISMFTSLTKFIIAPVPLFVFMGAILFHSGVAIKLLDVIDKWMGRMPGRLSLITLIAGTGFSALSGSTIATTGTLGTLLLPDMERRGYKKPLIIGPIMGVGGLAMVIPPSALAVVMGSIARISIGKLLIGGIIPGLLMAFLYITYIIGRCFIQPSMAPVYVVEHTTWSEKCKLAAKYVLPLSFIIFAVLGSIFLGIATPTEAAALGALASLIVSIAYGKMSLKTLKDSSLSCVEITAMVFMIIAGSIMFSQILGFSGTSRALVQVITGIDANPIMILIGMLIVTIILGTFMEQIAIMMITLPIYMPIIQALGFNDVWFGILMLISIEIGLTTPPFGMLCFVMKGVCSEDTTMSEVYSAALPFIICDILAVTFIVAFPVIVSFLPSFM